MSGLRDHGGEDCPLLSGTESGGRLRQNDQPGSGLATAHPEISQAMGAGPGRSNHYEHRRARQPGDVGALQPYPPGRQAPGLGEPGNAAPYLGHHPTNCPVYAPKLSPLPYCPGGPISGTFGAVMAQIMAHATIWREGDACKLLKGLVGGAGLEPATPCL